MNTKLLSIPAAALLGLSSLSAQAVPTPNLVDFFVNIDGVSTYGSPYPVEVDVSLFDDITGLGTITATITGAGSHSFDAFFDHDIGGSWTNETGIAKGVAAVGQSWEIDEPEYVYGDIVTNFENSALDNSNGLLGLDDVSMAMGWDFDLLDGQTAIISVLLGTDKPDADFYLKQKNIVGLTGPNPHSNYNIHLSSAIDVTGGTIPEPSMLLLLGVGLAGMVVTRRKVTL